MSENQSQFPTPSSFSFIPNQIELLVRHSGALSAQQVEGLISGLNTEFRLSLAQRGAPLTFNQNGQPVFSILPLRAGTSSADGPAILPVIGSINAGSAEILGNLLKAQTISPSAEAGAKPIQAEPNWQMMSSNHGQGTGGPGALPVLAPAGTGTASGQAAPALKGTAEAQKVLLAILDTHLTCAGCGLLPSAISQRLAFEMPMPAASHLAMAGHTSDGHEYLMTSHGVFAAHQAFAIIDKLAGNNPAVDATKIETVIYEALNHFGVGDVHHIYTILSALSAKTSEYPRMVINMSLMFHAPEGHQSSSSIFNPYGVALPIGMEAICHLLEAQGAVVVASAGNEALKGRHSYPGRPEPMYPAAYPSVIGVAALTKETDWEPAPYSNLSDTLSAGAGSPRLGFAAIGGGVVANNSKAEVAGPFVDAFPDGTPNTTAWAYWSGTSFAAPRVAGLAAVLLSNNAYTATPGQTTRKDVEDTINLNFTTAPTTPQTEPRFLL